MITVEHVRNGGAFVLNANNLSEMLYVIGDVKPNYPVPAIPLRIEQVPESVMSPHVILWEGDEPRRLWFIDCETSFSSSY